MTALLVSRDSIIDHAAATAGDVDRGRADPRATLAEVARAGLLDASVAAAGTGTADIAADAALLRTLAGQCMSTAFVTWAHRMVLDYLSRGRRSETTETLFADLLGGRRVGVTAMATGMKALAGLEDLTITATTTATGGLLVNGNVNWASNLVSGAIIVAPVQIDDGRRVVVWFERDNPAVLVRPVTGLLALDSTASGSLVLTDLEIEAEQIISDDFARFAASFRPTFLLLQTALALGLAERSIAEATTKSARPGLESLAPVVEHAASEVSEVARRFDAFVVAPADVAVLDLLQLRLDAALAAGTATRVELATSGGAGYLGTSAPARRFREAAFFPVQSPSEGQLRWEISSHN